MKRRILNQGSNLFMIVKKQVIYNNNNSNQDANKSNTFNKSKPKNVDDMLDDMLKIKNQPYNTYNKDTSNTQTSSYSNNYNSYTPSSTNNKKRNKLAFLRDGMVITFSSSGKKDMAVSKNSGYVYVELKEFSEDLYQTGQNQQKTEKEQRFIVINQLHLSKFLLLHPRTYVKKEALDFLQFTQKFRTFTIQQNMENKYKLTMEIFNKDENNEVINDDKIVSHIELNPEDIALLKLYLDYWIKDILNI